MAVNPQAQKLNLASNFVAQCQALATAYQQIVHFDQLFVKSGLAYVAGDFDNTTLAYVDPAQMGTIITELVAFKSWVDAGNLDAALKACNGAS